MDFVDGYDEYLFDQMEWVGDFDVFIWDVKLIGVMDDDVKVWVKDIKKLGCGLVCVYNDMEEWIVVVFELNVVDCVEMVWLLCDYVLGGVMMLEYWFGGGGDVNWVSVLEMGDLFFKVVIMWQIVWMNILEEVGCYQFYQCVLCVGQKLDWGKLEWKVGVFWLEMVMKDVVKIVVVMQVCVMVVLIVFGECLMICEMVLQIIVVVVWCLDVEIDLVVELVKVDQEVLLLVIGVGFGVVQLGIFVDLEVLEDGN